MRLLKELINAYCAAVNSVRGEAVVVKTEKPNQDVRFDVPAVGIKTLMSMIDSGCKVLAVEAEKTIFCSTTRCTRFGKPSWYCYLCC